MVQNKVIRGGWITLLSGLVRVMGSSPLYGRVFGRLSKCKGVRVGDKVSVGEKWWGDASHNADHSAALATRIASCLRLTKRATSLEPQR
jgi:hypothetical protein